MATISLSQSAKSDKATGKSEILIRFTVGSRINQRGKSNIFVAPKFWNADEQRLIIPKYRLLNEEQKQLVSELQTAETRLANLTEYIMKSFQDAGAGKKELSKDWLKSVIQSYYFADEQDKTEAEKRVSFFEAMQIYIDGKKLAEVRKSHYRVLYRMLQRFELYKGVKIEFDTLTADTIRDFEKFLREEHKIYKDAVEAVENAKGRKVKSYLDIMEAVPQSREPEQRGDNAVSGIMKRFRAFVRWANGLDKDYRLNEPLTTNNPFSTYSIGREIYGTPYYLTLDERNKLAVAELPERLARQRDIFIFQCLIGCRVSDLWSMTKANVINGAVEYIPRKTKEGNPVTVRVPLNEKAKAILDRYKDVKGDKLFPFVAQQQYNEDIKEMLRLSGIDRMVTILNPTNREEEQRPIYEVASSHMARRTFVGNLYKQVKDPNLVGSLSGHVEGSKAFVRYREIDEDMKKELVSLLD